MKMDPPSRARDLLLLSKLFFRAENSYALSWGSFFFLFPRSERYHDHLHEKRKSKVFFVPSVRDRAKMSGKSRVVVDRPWGGGKRNERGGEVAGEAGMR